MESLLQRIVETGSQIEREVYLSLTLNRDKGRIALIASVAGGMDIEEVAAHTPEKIVSVSVHPAAGLQPYQCRKLAFALGFEGKQIAAFQKIATALFQACVIALVFGAVATGPIAEPVMFSAAVGEAFTVIASEITLFVSCR